jgi:pimeloyl-ACP methyl ester carboxylesterase
MRRKIRSAFRVFAAFVLCLLLAVSLVIFGGLAWRLHLRNQTAPLLALRGPEAIHDSRYVTIGGVKQWISIRGENRSNPVILFVHGGPGNGQSGQAAIFRKWENDFTVVQWDQRGGGLTFAAGALLTADIPMGRMVSDGIEARITFAIL